MCPYFSLCQQQYLIVCLVIGAGFPTETDKQALRAVLPHIPCCQCSCHILGEFDKEIVVLFPLFLS